MLRKLYLFVLFVLVACVGCQWNLRSSEVEKEDRVVEIERSDRIELLYLTTGDFAALQQMKTLYPSETRTLIEDMLKLGRVDEPDINTRFLYFFQDSTLQELMQGVDEQYADVTDLNGELTDAFTRLVTLMPELEIPRVYTQIGSLDQSVVVGDSLVGISLDKYLGADYPIYQRYGYTEEQRAMMTRQYIVPDCLGFYLLRHFPMSTEALDSQELRHEHMAKIQYVVNKAMSRRVFTNERVKEVENYMKAHRQTGLDELLNAKKYQ